jgi:hypothetical protein
MKDTLIAFNSEFRRIITWTFKQRSILGINFVVAMRHFFPSRHLIGRKRFSVSARKTLMMNKPHG